MGTLPKLLIPAKADSERELVASAWEAAGGEVVRIEKFWESPVLDSQEPIAIYGNDTFALVLAQVLHLRLFSPDDTLITRLPVQWTKRNLQLLEIRMVEDGLFPCFVKPAVPKQFKAQVLSNLDDFQATTDGLPQTEQVMFSEVVAVIAEARAFILAGKVQTAAIYEGLANLEEAVAFASAFASEFAVSMPAAYVIDLGFAADLGWFVLEFNAAWGAGLNGCDPEKAILAIAAATKAIA